MGSAEPVPVSFPSSRLLPNMYLCHIQPRRSQGLPQKDQTRRHEDRRAQKTARETTDDARPCRTGQSRSCSCSCRRRFRECQCQCQCRRHSDSRVVEAWYTCRRSDACTRAPVATCQTWNGERSGFARSNTCTSASPEGDTEGTCDT
jgi:hypothetical protein